MRQKLVPFVFPDMLRLIFRIIYVFVREERYVLVESSYGKFY